MCECERVCVRENERENVREKMCLCVREREKWILRERECEGERDGSN